ncbi:MAG TPA: FadR/GntR family transcriptional regulator [Rhodocyclaceae bacterium]|nr:FadR/GntR family transcriptional regulator [Rhodocyclaceae bacterium]
MTSQVVKDLAHRIDHGELRPGDRLPTERELMVMYGVSRTVVREATSSLRSAGRITTQQGRGAFVLGASQLLQFDVELAAQSSGQDLLDILDIRIGLESEAAALAARRRTPATLELMTQTLAALEVSLHAGSSARSLDLEFHLSIARAAGNHYFADLLGKLSRVPTPSTRQYMHANNPRARSEHLQRVRFEHTEIFQAIKRGDADVARAAMRLHLANSRERMRIALESIAAASVSTQASAVA